MQMTIYIDGETKSVFTTQPNLVGKNMIEVILPEGMPLSFLVTQLQSLDQSVSYGANAVIASMIVIKVVYGS